MKILFISPLPPPVHGQSLAGEMAIKGLLLDNKLTVIDSALDKSFSGNKLPKIYSPKRIYQIVKVIISEFKKVWLTQYDVVYMSVGITFRGFLRYAPYMIAAIIKREPYFIHTHGSTFKIMFNELSSFKKKIISFFIVKSRSIIVLGNSLTSMFNEIIPIEKISVCENGVADNIYITENEFNVKCNNFNNNQINLLFLSNLMRAKGVLELIKAFDFLPENYILNIAGGIEPDNEIVEEFEKFKHRYPNRVIYHGIISGEQKRKLLCESDIFVLPSKNEGQPISILEAYRCGCGVVTDDKIGGISDIFRNKINGETVDSNSFLDISRGIKECFNNIEQYSKANIRVSSHYTSTEFCKRLSIIINKI